MENSKLSVFEKCAYGLGDMACNLFWGLIILSATFYTEYFGMTAAAAATMMFVVRLFDISFDVIIGAVADRHKTKYGRFRPWILYGLIPFCVIGFFAFFTPAFSETMKIVYAYVTFLLFMLMYSVVNVPYGSLMGVISDDPEERTSVSAYRNVFAQIGCLVVYGTLFTTVRYLIDTFKLDKSVAFSIIVGVYTLVVFISLLCTFYFTKERVEPVKAEKSNLVQDIKELAHNPSWIILTIAGVMTLVFIFGHSGLTTYYAKYYVANTVVHNVAVITDVKKDQKDKDIYFLDNGSIDSTKKAMTCVVGMDTLVVERAFQCLASNGKYESIDKVRGKKVTGKDATPQVGDKVSYFTYEVSGTFLGFKINWELLTAILLSISSLITIIGTLLIQGVVKKFGKKWTWIACFVLASIVSVLFLFVPKDSLGAIIVLQTLFTLFIGPASYIMWSMYADVADEAEVKTGNRATGLIFSSATMAQKLGNTLANSVPIWVLGAIGFVSNDLNMTEETQNVILKIFALFPLVGSVIAVIALSFYKLDEKQIQENSAKLAAMKATKKA